ncbi:MAG TPA: anhydro-N-acetylmuramic acid kinase, partial [Candidatus Saccharimonadales bacterium]|nr:anhydro-N-acetylmuramic acid kinase [Candidatus Saccharimonadales bacterium]
SNVTSIDWRGRKRPAVLAFDTGPANMLVDLAARRQGMGKMDRGGRSASRGTPSEELISEWLRDPFFHKTPPKSTGREYFGEGFYDRVVAGRNLSSHTLLATFTEFTARSVALNYELHLKSSPDEIILTGGGAKNPTMVSRLRKALGKESAGITIKVSEDVGWPASAIEPAAFAWLAFLRMKKRPGNLPRTTGAKREVLLGQLIEPARQGR